MTKIGTKIAYLLTKCIDFFYDCLAQYIQRFCTRQLFRYAFCGVSNLVLDWFLYFIVYNFVIGHNLVYFSFLGHQFCITPHIATLCFVFPITLCTGFWLNKYITFVQSNLNSYRQLTRYISIVAINLLLNYFGLKLLVEVAHWYPTVSKIFITLITVLVSYIGQKYYTFAVKKK